MMTEWFSGEVGAWFASYLLHSTVLLGIAWLLDASGMIRRTGSRELLWRAAMFGAVLTASTHVFLPQVSVLGNPLAAATPAAVSAPYVQGIADTAADTTDTIVSPPPPAAPVVSQQQGDPVFSLPNVSLPTSAFYAWLFIATVLLLRLAVTGVLAARELAGRSVVTSGALHERLRNMCAAAGIARVPRLSIVDDLPGPLTLPNNEICLPRWASETLDPIQLDAMLAHELAHVQHRDPLLLIATTILAAVFFFQPFNRIAHRRLAMFAELNADAFAAGITRDPRALAETLAQCAQKIHDRPAMPNALRVSVAMARPHSPLVERVRRLLGDIPMKDRNSSAAARVTVTTALLGALLLLPVFTLPAVHAKPNPPDRPESETLRESRTNSLRVVRDDTHNAINFQIGRSGYFLVVEAEGEVTFTPDERDIESVGGDGKLLIREKIDGVVHEIKVRNDDGEMLRTYSRDRREMPFDATARKWLATVIPDVLLNTGLNAEQRVGRILADGGVPAVLEEMKRIGSDFALNRYVDVLLHREKLDSGDMKALLEIIAGIDSDFEQRAALERVISTQDLSADNQVQLLQTAAGIGSDFELAELVQLVTPRLTLNDDSLQAWQVLVAEIGSDFEQRRALGAVFKHREIPKAWQLAALRAAQESIGSDFELRSLLEQSATRIGSDPDLRDAYIDAVAEIGSDFEARQAIVALVDNAKLDTEGFGKVLDAMRGVGSDFETLQALQAIAKEMPRDDALVSRYHDLANTLSDHERQQAERALR